MPGHDHELPESKEEVSPSQLESEERTANGSGGIRKFTWKELGKLNQRHNAHIAYRGKVRYVDTDRNWFYTVVNNSRKFR